MNTNQINSVLRLPQVISATGMSKATIYLWMSENRFPKPVRIGQRSVAWVAQEINDWILECIRQRNKQVNGGAK